MGIIDFRVRPLISGYQQMYHRGTIDKFLTAFRCEWTPSMQQMSVELLLREMDDAGVELSVLPGRQEPNAYVPNEDLVELSMKYPDRFTVFPLYDPLRPEESLKEVSDYVLHGPCRGISIEPGFGNELRFDDEGYHPLYEFMNEQGLPLMTTFSGSITKTIDTTLPGRFHWIAKTYPNISVVAGHGGWPWFRELYCAAFFSENIYLVPDLYSLHCPGENDARTAAEYILRDKMMFGSSYPLLPVGAAVENAKGWNLSPDAEAMFFHDTAAKLLKL